MPGVYCFFDSTGVLVYVGKAKNLRSRLSHYRLAKRGKKDRKKKRVLNAAFRLSYEVTESELEAELREIRLIQDFRPKFNVSLAYSFLYPFVGIGTRDPYVFFCLTTHPERFTDLRFYGAFRSRMVVGEAFFSLMRLLKRVGHPAEPRLIEAWKKVPHSYVFAFRKLPLNWFSFWDDFFRGYSRQALEELCLKLLEHASARKYSEQVQEDLQALQKFFKEEARTLAEAIRTTAYPNYPVAQKERDPLFLRYRVQPPCNGTQ